MKVSVERMLDLFNRQVAARPEYYPGITLPLKLDDRATWWHGNTVKGLVVPLGRAGATGAQCLDLGRPDATTHHALLAGRIRSGKSTLLHTAITSLALTYSPAEVELYLLDFKVGVEFEVYARHGLPHARVIALETDPEFGLSVLQGLAEELDRRATLFKAASDRFSVNVPNLSVYRSVSEAALPRILLIVDEFQKFFVADDAVSRQAGQALDHLARQGPAFGIPPATRLADAGGRLHAPPIYYGPDGGPHRHDVRRGRFSLDSVG